jgi:surfactin synthase thioesterase subunit
MGGGARGRRRAPLADALAAELVADGLPDRYALFGHSMGALIAFELARRLPRAGRPPPIALYVSAHRAPHVPDPVPVAAHRFDDAELIARLRELQGTPEEVLSDPELRAVALPTIRADFAVCETYALDPGPPLDCPVVVYLPGDDDRISVEDARGWERHTTGPFALVRLRGDHFFLRSDPGELLADLAARLRQVAARGHAP